MYLPLPPTLDGALPAEHDTRHPGYPLWLLHQGMGPLFRVLREAGLLARPAPCAALARAIGLMAQALRTIQHAGHALRRELPDVFQEPLPLVEKRHHRFDQCRPLSAQRGHRLASLPQPATIDTASKCETRAEPVAPGVRHAARQTK